MRGWTPVASGMSLGASTVCGRLRGASVCAWRRKAGCAWWCRFDWDVPGGRRCEWWARLATPWWSAGVGRAALGMLYDCAACLDVEEQHLSKCEGDCAPSQQVRVGRVFMCTNSRWSCSWLCSCVLGVIFHTGVYWWTTGEFRRMGGSGGLIIGVLAQAILPRISIMLGSIRHLGGIPR